MGNTVVNYSDYYREYCDNYHDYKNASRRLAGFDEKIKSKSIEKETLEEQRGIAQADLDSKNTIYREIHSKYLQGKEAYDKNSVRRENQIQEELNQYKDKLEKNIKQQDVTFGRYTSGNAYSQDVELVTSKQKTLRREYIDRRTAEIQQEKKSLEAKRELYVSDPEKAARREIDSSDEYGRVYEKKAFIEKYFSAKRIRRSTIIKEIQSDIASREISSEFCGDSVVALKENVLTDLIDTELLPVDDVKDPEKAKAYLKDNPSMLALLLSIGSGVFLLVGFIMWFPLDDIIPTVIDTSNWWVIFGWLAWLLDKMRFVLIWALQLLSCLIVIVLVSYLLEGTSLAVLFYHPRSSVEDGINRFKENYYKYPDKYAVIFHYNEAVKMALGKELDRKIKECSDALLSITEESDYQVIIRNGERELSELEAERLRQVSEKNRLLHDSEVRYQQAKAKNDQLLSSKERELNSAEDERLQAMKQAYDRLYMVDSNALSEVNKCKVTLEEYEDKIKGLTQEIATANEQKKADETFCKTTYDKLLAQSEEMRRGDFIENSVVNLFSPDSLEALNGNLTNQLYFISDKLDEENLAMITVMQSVCRPMVCIYRKTELSTANLCNELAGFIKWYGDTIQRVTPVPLIDGKRFVVIDTATGAELFQDNKEYFAYKVASSNDEVRAYTDHLKSKISLIRSSATELNTEMSINSVNEKKAEINRQAVPHATSVNVMQEQYCGYSIAFFIMPSETKGHTRDNTGLTEELQHYYHNCELYGFMPIFLIDNETWENEHPSPSVEYLRTVVRNRDYRYITGIGTRPQCELKISMSPIFE